VPDRYRLDARECSFRRRFRGADHAAKTCAACPLRYRKGSGDRPDAPVERKLADRSVVGESLRGQLPRRGEKGEGDREVEAGPFLAQGGRCEVDRDPAVDRPLERGRDDPASDTVFGFLAGSVGEADDRESRHAGL
jgi:hypothetical protein